MLLALLLSCGPDISIAKIYDEPEDTGIMLVDSAEPPLEERSGITGYSSLHLRQVACPACMGESQELSITFQAEFHQPISDSYTTWIPSINQCTTTLVGVNPSAVSMDVGSSISISNPLHSFVAPSWGGGLYGTSDIWEDKLQRDSLYDVETDIGSYTFLSSHGFDFIEPYTMLWTEPSYAFDAPIYRTGATFTWGPTSLDAIFTITVAVYSSNGNSMLGYVACTGQDNGIMTIPSQYLAQYPVNSLVSIHMSRHRIELVETDINNSYIESHTEWEVVGTGHIE